LLGLGGLGCLAMVSVGTYTINLLENIEDAVVKGDFVYAIDNHDTLIIMFYWAMAAYNFSVVVSFAVKLTAVAHKAWNRMVSVSIIRQRILIPNLEADTVWIYLHLRYCGDHHFLLLMYCRRLCQR
jgi:hypothetical protein